MEHKQDGIKKVLQLWMNISIHVGSVIAFKAHGYKIHFDSDTTDYHVHFAFESIRFGDNSLKSALNWHLHSYMLHLLTPSNNYTHARGYRKYNRSVLFK